MPNVFELKHFSRTRKVAASICIAPIWRPTRLSRLLMAACLAYLWIIHLGALCEQDGWISIIHRSDRCDLSLFQLGLRLLAYLLNADCTIPVAFYVSI